MIFDEYHNVVLHALYSMYTTLFVTCVLIVGTSIYPILPYQHDEHTPQANFLLVFFTPFSNPRFLTLVSSFPHPIFLFSSFKFPLFLFLFLSFPFPFPLFSSSISISGTYFFSSDVNKLIINPIERLVDLVRKISDNPLGVEYKMLGEKEGFVAGMETTILLTTINRIGGKYC